MLQRVYRQLKTVDPNARITIATGKSQISSIKNQVGKDVGISVEQCRRDTFPAIALASAYLVDVQGVDSSEAVVVCPVDPYVEDSYFYALKELAEYAESKEAENLVLMGIEPTFPTEKYGYIIPENADHVSKVSQFKEKPDAKTAEVYIERGALWNGGVFAYRLSYILDKTNELLGYSDYSSLYENYASLPQISLDYAVVEKEKSIAVIRYNGTWKDIGTWNTLTEAMDSEIVGNAQLNENCSNVHIINELDMPILAMGLHDVVISASAEGILVSDKEQSSYIKPYVDALGDHVHFADKSWGSFKVIDVGEESMTIKVTLNPGNRMNYHSHEYRDEVWTVINGEGRTIVDGMEQPVHVGDVITMQAGCRHTVIADTELKLIEVQLGKDIRVSDKKKYDLEGCCE